LVLAFGSADKLAAAIGRVFEHCTKSLRRSLVQVENTEDALSQRVIRLVQAHQEQAIMIAIALAGGYDKGARRLTEGGAIPVDYQ
jgi:hypothetical protein